MAQITKQKVMEMAVTLAAGVLSNTANGRMIIDLYSGISNTLQDCVTAIESAAFSFGYEIVLEKTGKQVVDFKLNTDEGFVFLNGAEQTDDSDDVYNAKGGNK